MCRQLLKWVHVPAGSPVYTQGSVAKAFYIILEGMLFSVRVCSCVHHHHVWLFSGTVAFHELDSREGVDHMQRQLAECAMFPVFLDDVASTGSRA